MLNKFTQSNYHQICDKLAAADVDLGAIINAHDYSPMWSRPNTFETLVHIILEQQVSLASALSALNKLKERVQELTPVRVLLLTDEEFKQATADGFVGRVRKCPPAFIRHLRFCAYNDKKCTYKAGGFFHRFAIQLAYSFLKLPLIF
jgi:hypothetical protein